MKSSYIRGDQTIRKDDFMPTTNISQIISDVIGSVRFLRIEQRRFVEKYSCALFLSAYKNTSRLAPFCSSSQSSISRLLSSQFISSDRIRHEFIENGKPQQNGFSESFNARFGDECLRMLDLNLIRASL